MTIRSIVMYTNGDNDMVNAREDVKAKAGAELSGKNGVSTVARTPFVNLEHLCFLLEKTREAGDSLVDQNVWLFIGATGSGKTTTVLYLAGSKFQEEDVEGFDHYVPVDFPQAKLKEFKVAPGGQSVTKTIQTIELSIHDKVTLFADTPGFNDTEGVEMDIANGLGLIRALQRANSVKPVLVCNANGLDDRFRSLYDTLDTVARMMSASKDVDFTKFNYLFTRCDEKASKRMHQRLSSSQNKLKKEVRTNSLLISLLEDMIEKTSPQALYIDPMDEDYLKVLNELCRDDERVLSPDSFKPFVTQKARDKLYAELEYQISTIQTNIRALDMESVDTTLQLLGRLAVVLPEAVTFAGRAASAVLSQYTKAKDRACHLVQSLMGYESSSHESIFIDTVEEAESKLRILTKMGSLALVRDLDENMRPDVFLPPFFEELFEKRLSIETCIEEVDKVKWALSRLYRFANAFGDFPGANGFRLKFSEDYNFVAGNLNAWLRFAREQIKGTIVDINTVEKHVMFGVTLSQFLKSEGMTDSSGKLAFDTILESTLDTLSERTSDSIQKIHATLEPIKGKQPLTVDEDLRLLGQLTDLVEPRKFLVALSATQLCQVIKLSSEEDQPDKCTSSLDNEICRLLESLCQLIVARLEQFKKFRDAKLIPDLSSQLNRTLQICERVESWTSFNYSDFADMIRRYATSALDILQHSALRQDAGCLKRLIRKWKGECTATANDVRQQA